MSLCKQGGNLMFAADCRTKRAAFMTDMTQTLESRTCISICVCDYLHLKLCVCVITCSSLELFRVREALRFCCFHAV